MLSTRGKISALLLAPAMLLATWVITSDAGAATQHCAGHQTEVKVEVGQSPATVQVLDTTTNQLVWVVITITGTTFKIEPLDPNVVLTNASWCIKSSTNTNNGTGTTGVSGSKNKQGITQDISYVVVYSVTTEPDIPDPTPCEQTTTSGGQGVTVTVHELDFHGPLAFPFFWEAYSQPDRFEVLYEGNVVYDTGLVGDDINEGTGSVAVILPAGTSTLVTVRVTGPDTGTEWDYTVKCPVTGPFPI